MTSRRQFLKTSALVGTGLAIGSPMLLSSQRARAFGEVPSAASSVMLPENRRVQNVLEVFLYGGLSPWESLYLVEDYGRSKGEQFHTFGGMGPESVRAALTGCGVPDDDPIGTPFARDALGVDVSFGPFARALRGRPDVTGRMRVLVQKHDLLPHEAAVPYALTGRRLGSRNNASFGAHVERYFSEREPSRKSPFSYVLGDSNAEAADNLEAALITGAHPGRARPVRIRIDQADRLTRLLTRPSAGALDERQARDALLDHYVLRNRERLRFRGQGGPLRSERFDQHAAASRSLANVEALASLLPESVTLEPATWCGQAADFNSPKLCLELAARLLTHSTEAARYVCVVDTGLIAASGGGGYDTHSDHCRDTARNLDNVLTHLLAQIRAPGENAPGKLDLDRTMIVLNTEFGRTPTAQDGTGRNHHPGGYVTALIGGTVTGAERGIHGAIGSNGLAKTALTPAESRIAALLALGIFPFSPEAFFVSDVPGASTEAGAIARVTEQALGVRV